jgi:hypothetical protein
MQTPEETLSALKSSDWDAGLQRGQELLSRAGALPPQKHVEIRPGVTLRLTSGGIGVVRFHYLAHPDRDPERHPDWKARERRKYTSQASWDREQEIMDEAGGGELVFWETINKYWKKIVITDPGWRPDPGWRVEGGFDHGKTNPTALERVYVDFDGNLIFAGEYYQPGKEIWQHAPVMKRMPDFPRMEPCFADPTIFPMTVQQSQRPGEAVQRAKSIAELYAEQGIEGFIPFAYDRSDVSFAARMHLHWSDLEHRAPSVRIVCRNWTETPQPGLHPWDCPNLLWELMRARRVKLTAQQLLSRNVSEALVDKDNHARDAMKYQVMSHPEPAKKSVERRVQERLTKIIEGDKERGIEPHSEEAMTSAMVNFQKILREEQQDDDDDDGPYQGPNARRRIRDLQRRRLRRY